MVDLVRVEVAPGQWVKMTRKQAQAHAAKTTRPADKLLRSTAPEPDEPDEPDDEPDEPPRPRKRAARRSNK